MSQVSHGYIQGMPWVKVHYTLQTGTPPTPPTPPAPPVYFSISGTVTDSGSGYVAGLAFPGIGTIFSDAAGSYFQPVVSGYSGVVIPLSTGTFAPASRTYTNVGTDFTAQDYAHGTASPLPPPSEAFFLISGTVTDAGTGFSAAIEFTGTGTIASAASGSYGLLVGESYAGTAIPHLAGGAFTPRFRVYSSIGSNLPNEDYDFNHTPVAFAQTVFVQTGSSVSITLTGSDYENSGLACSAVTLPGSGQLTHGGAYTPNIGFTGTDSFLFACTDTGANPLTSPLAQVTIIVTGTEAPTSPMARYFISSDETEDYSSPDSDGTQRALDFSLTAPGPITDHEIIVDGMLDWWATFMTRSGHPALIIAPNGHYKLSLWLKYNKMATVTGRTPRLNIDVRIKHFEDPAPPWESAGSFDILYSGDNIVFQDSDDGVWQRVDIEVDVDWAVPLLVTDRIYIYAHATQGGGSMIDEPWGFTIRTGGGSLVNSTYFEMPFADI